MKKIAVIGSINMDLTAQTDRHPGKGETVSGRDLRYIPGGKGANQAVAAARLGGDVTMFGCVGDDAFASHLVENLRCNHVDVSHICQVPEVSSGIAMITVAENDNSIVVIPGANQYVTVEFLKEKKNAILKTDIILLQNEIPIESVAYVASLAADSGKTVIYNPAPVVSLPGDIIKKVSFMTPNEHEARQIFPEGESMNSLLEKYEGKLVVTLGAEGAAAWTGESAVRIPVRPARVVDTTGAGDTFNGAFAFALASDYSIKQALHFANTAASLSTEKYGAQGGMPDYETVMKSL